MTRAAALDVALWDLKARLLGVCLTDALPRERDVLQADVTRCGPRAAA